MKSVQVNLSAQQYNCLVDSEHNIAYAKLVWLGILATKGVAASDIMSYTFIKGSDIGYEVEYLPM